ncbi:MAG: Prolipoprotein diacylglyceryl transferase [bacterium ADurb.Bin363]|mgnify:CR=1 FL=1|nr:MAG: Prolipoprotein diacylglyceryl transferase [bacterium ADurb.Bin363]
MHRVLFHVGSLSVYSYGFMIALGLIFALFIGIKYGKDRGINSDQIILLVICTFFSGVIGSRILYIILNYTHYAGDPLRTLNIRTGGLAWHGGVIGGLIFIIWFSKKMKLSLWDMMDIGVICGILGLAFGRIGCFLNGCCYGKISSVPWAVVFPNLGRFPRHPTQIYECILDIIVLLVLLYIWKRHRFSGEVFCYFTGLYSVVRFIVEFFRDGSNPILIGLNLAQLTSLIIIFFTLLLYRKLYSSMF